MSDLPFNLAASGGPGGQQGVECVPIARPDAAAFIYPEGVLARDFGVNRALIRSFRQDERRTFTRGTDYDTVGRNVQWTKAGALRLCNALGVIPSRDLLDGAPMSHTVNGKEALRDTAAVVRWRIPNPHLLLCKRNTGGEEVWVSVPSNLNFRERMTVKIFLDVNGWRLDGRCPRFPGRW